MLSLSTRKQVTTSSLDMDHAHIQITHAELYFTPEELQERRTKFEWENKISQFVFETPFTPDGKQYGDVTWQCMRKTILTSTCSGHTPIPENPTVWNAVFHTGIMVTILYLKFHSNNYIPQILFRIHTHPHS